MASREIDPKQKNQGPEQNREGGGHKQDGGGLPPEKSSAPKSRDPERDEVPTRTPR